MNKFPLRINISRYNLIKYISIKNNVKMLDY